MNSTDDQLSKLNTLLESGVLTQEEFDAAKQRILNEDTSSNPTNFSQKAPTSNEEDTPDSESSSKEWILWVAGGVLVAIFLFVILGRNTDDPQINVNETQGWEDGAQLEDETQYLTNWEAAKAEADPHFEEVLADDEEIILDNGLTFGNPWQKDYFHNEWGEKIMESPFIYATLDGTGWDIHIDFIPPTEESRWGVFRFYLLDSDYHKTSSYGPVNILVRGTDGDTKVIDVTGTRDGITFVEDPAAIALLKYYLNQETFDLRMEFEKYNERHATQGHWSLSADFFQEAVDKLL